jgi:hypothetical protein
VSLLSASLGGVIKLAGVVVIDDSFDETNPGRKPGAFMRCFAASSAASCKDTAELFLCVVLNLNLLFGANLVRVSSNFSVRALMAYLDQQLIPIHM